MNALHGYPVDAPALARPIIFDQQWCDVAFVHWPVAPSAVAHMFPPGTRPDLFNGMTYVALVPFSMRSAAFRPGWSVPYFGTFLETNVRLYSIDDEGRHGVVFRSLDTSRLAIVPFARAVFGIPYTWSRMRMRRTGDVVRYVCRRRYPNRGLRSDLEVRIADRVDPDDLEIWLTSRWGAHSRWAGRTIWVPNAHERWPLHAGEVLELADDLLAGSGISPSGARLRVLWSPGVHAQFGRPATVSV